MPCEIRVVYADCNLHFDRCRYRIQVLNKSYASLEAYAVLDFPVNVYVHRANMQNVHAFFIFILEGPP